MEHQEKLRIDKNFSTASLSKQKVKPIRVGMVKDHVDTRIKRIEVEAVSLAQPSLNSVPKQERSMRMGLYNHSNACYQLAVIQCLNTVQPLVDHLRAQCSRSIRDTRMTGLVRASFPQVSRPRKGKGMKNILKASKARMCVLNILRIPFLD